MSAKPEPTASINGLKRPLLTLAPAPIRSLVTLRACLSPPSRNCFCRPPRASRNPHRLDAISAVIPHLVTDRKLIFEAPPFIVAARVKENWFWIPFILVPCCHTGGRMPSTALAPHSG